MVDKVLAYKIEIALGLIFISTIFMVYMKYSREFGRLYRGNDLKKIKKSKNFRKGRFWNREETTMLSNFSIRGGIRWLRKNNKVPTQNIEVEKLNLEDLNTDDIKFSWFGHSTVLLSMEGKRVFFDPMLTEIPSPIKIPFLVSRRFSRNLPIEIEDIDYIDAIVISHDHYDHLDYMSIKKLSDKVGVFYVPLGVMAHLRSWGISDDKVVEFDWWDSIKLDNLEFICTPARHFSGRGIFHKNSTLWASWVVKSKYNKVFFTGDTGYSSLYKEIGEKYGPFDLAFVECGQYDDMWPSIHMLPEESIKLASDIKAKNILAMHWGGFKLSAHPWSDPIKRILKENEKYNINIITPKIGEVVDLSFSLVTSRWWA